MTSLQMQTGTNPRVRKTGYYRSVCGICHERGHRKPVCPVLGLEAEAPGPRTPLAAGPVVAWASLAEAPRSCPRCSGPLGGWDLGLKCLCGQRYVVGEVYRRAVGYTRPEPVPA